MNSQVDGDFFEARLVAYGIAGIVGGYCFTPLAHFVCDAGARCLACGMRTGPLAFLRGDFGAALEANPMSVLLGCAALAAVVDVVITCFRLRRGRGL